MTAGSGGRQSKVTRGGRPSSPRPGCQSAAAVSEQSPSLTSVPQSGSAVNFARPAAPRRQSESNAGDALGS